VCTFVLLAVCRTRLLMPCVVVYAAFDAGPADAGGVAGNFSPKPSIPGFFLRSEDVFAARLIVASSWPHYFVSPISNSSRANPSSPAVPRGSHGLVRQDLGTCGHFPSFKTRPLAMASVPGCGGLPARFPPQNLHYASVRRRRRILSLLSEHNRLYISSSRLTRKRITAVSAGCRVLPVNQDLHAGHPVLITRVPWVSRWRGRRDIRGRRPASLRGHPLR